MAINTSNTALKVFLWILLMIYLAVLTKMILFKHSPGYIKRHFLEHYSWRQAKENLHTANLKPFTTIRLYLNSHGDPEYATNNLWGNIIGFIPLGILLPLLFARLRTVFRLTFTVFIFSLAFESFQLFGMLGVFDVDDLILNTLGGLAGFIFYLLLSKVTNTENA